MLIYIICPLDSIASLNQGSFVLEDHNSKFGRNLGEVNIKSAWKRGCRSLWSFTLQKDSWAFSKVLLLPWRSRAPLTMAVQFQFKSGRALGFGCSLHGGLALQVIPGQHVSSIPCTSDVWYETWNIDIPNFNGIFKIPHFHTNNGILISIFQKTKAHCVVPLPAVWAFWASTKLNGSMKAVIRTDESPDFLYGRSIVRWPLTGRFQCAVS